MESRHLGGVRGRIGGARRPAEPRTAVERRPYHFYGSAGRLALPRWPGRRESIKETEQPQRYLVAGANLHVVVCDIALWQVLYLVK